MANKNEIEFLDIEEFENAEKIPVVPLRRTVVFPHTAVHLDIQRETLINTIEYAEKNGEPVLLVMTKDPISDSLEFDNLYNIGTVATIKKVTKLPRDKGIRVILDSKIRVRVVDAFKEEGVLFSKVLVPEPILPPKLTKKVTEQMRTLKALFAQYCQLFGGKIAEDVIKTVDDLNDVAVLTDTVLSSLIIDPDNKQFFLENFDPKSRLKDLLEILPEEIKYLKIEIDIQNDLEERLEKNQRDYYLREKIRVIKDQLSGSEEGYSEPEDYEERLDKLNVSKEVKDKIHKEIVKLSSLPPFSQESSVSETYLETVFDLPWDKASKENIDIEKCESFLNADHYGLFDVKEKLTEYLAAKKINPSIKSQILCLVGPPGVGKTSIVRSVAKALGRKYQRISLGGVHDEAEIRGHRRTYVGSMPGKIISAIRNAGVNNPIILLDEIDKISSDHKGDPASALLEALDSEQNFSFNDHYLDLPFDLSNVLFITTANSTDTIPDPLLDRMELIQLSGYTRYEKFVIATNHLIKKQYKEHKITKRQISIADEVIYTIIDFYIREAGVRNLERTIISLIRKAEKKYLKTGKAIKITNENLKEFLGRKKYIAEEKFSEPQIGAAMGLAWTQAGGDTLFCEAVAVEGTGKIVSTGSLGDVMKESAQIASTHIRSISDTLGIEKDFHKTKDIFIHFPDGATPKDGPSAGITVALAVTSALTGRKIRCDIAMTGEISIRGKVLPIGGLKEKVLAAYRVGIHNIIIPKDNEKDIEDIPKEIAGEFNFIKVSEFSEVLAEALLPKEEEITKSNPVISEMRKYKHNKNTWEL